MSSSLFDDPHVPCDAVFNIDEAGLVWSSRAQTGRKHVLHQGKHVVGDAEILKMYFRSMYHTCYGSGLNVAQKI